VVAESKFDEKNYIGPNRMVKKCDWL
jgi:hypothetical protein